MILLDGKAIAKKIVTRIKATNSESIVKTPHTLAILWIGNDYATKKYVGIKKRVAKEVGLNVKIFHFSDSTSKHALLNKLRELNREDAIGGILLQLPLPKTFNKFDIINAIDPHKDVDGLHPYNLGKVFNGDETYAPATPKGIIKLLEAYGIDVARKNCVIVGTSNIIGIPLTGMLLTRKASVTALNINTPDISPYTKNADILISATGVPKLIGADMVKEGAVVVDCGIAKDPVSKKLCGDVDFEKVAPKCSYITPVPGGVGPMTVATLIQSTVEISALIGAPKH